MSGSAHTDAAVIRRRKRVAHAFVTFAALLMVGSVITYLVYGRVGALYRDWVLHNVIAGLSFAVIVALAIRRQPRNNLLWVIVALTIVSGAQAASRAAGIIIGDRTIGVDRVLELASSTTMAPADLPLSLAVALAVSSTVWVFAVGGVLTFTIALFPDGNLPSRRWRPLVPAALAGMVLVAAGLTIAAWPTSTVSYYDLQANLPRLPATLAVAGFVLVVSASVASVASLFARYRSANDDERRQLQWLAFGGLVFVAASAVAWIVGLTTPGRPEEIYRPVATAGFPLVLGAYGVAILRYRLYDVDVVISKTAVVTALAAFIGGVYIGVVVGIGSLLGRGDEPSLALSIVATALVAVAFQPVRERVRRRVNRLVFGQRATPYEVLTGLAHTSVDDASDDVLSRVAELVVAGTNATSAAVWVRIGDELRAQASYPDGAPTAPLAVDDMMQHPAPDDGGPLRVPVRHEGELLGMLSGDPGRGQTLTPADRSLLDDVAEALGLVLRNVQLTARLRDRVEQLERSRQRILAAQDEARRKIERDIHDGPQQNLAALRVRLAVARQEATRDGVQQLRTLLGQAEEDTNRAISILRELARGVYPPLLEAEGLPAALRAQAARLPLPVTIHAPELGRLSPDVEAAVYFTVLEALNNAVKYADATCAHVELRDEDEELHFEISDDGTGFDPHDTTTEGTGLSNIRDRIDSTGGTVTITSTRGRGTTIRGSVPISNAESDEQRTNLNA